MKTASRIFLVVIVAVSAMLITSPFGAQAAQPEPPSVPLLTARLPGGGTAALSPIIHPGSGIYTLLYFQDWGSPGSEVEQIPFQTTFPIYPQSLEVADDGTVIATFQVCTGREFVATRLGGEWEVEVGDYKSLTVKAGQYKDPLPIESLGKGR